VRMARAVGASASSLLDGLAILVVEDEALVSFLLEDILKQDLGCPLVWLASDAVRALEIAAEQRVDAAVLDVNLKREPVFPLAERLAALGIPFIFATGYGRAGIPDRWAATPVIQKPFAAASLGSALQKVLPGKRPGP
jgi:CheY-like chemotaxis protein